MLGVIARLQHLPSGRQAVSSSIMLHLALLLSVLTAAAGCTDDPAGGLTTDGPGTLQIQGGSSILSVGETMRLGTVLRDSAGNLVSDYAVAWSSSDSLVASVDSVGTVTARSEGSTAITASAAFELVGQSHRVSTKSVIIVDGSSTAEMGALTVRVSTSGRNIDADGYTVRIVGGAKDAVDVNGDVTFMDLVAGEYEVGLTNVAVQCSVEGSNPRTVTVEEDVIASAAFAVNCTDDPGQAEKRTMLFGPFVEWTFENDSYAGNPFDLVAAATFEHQGSGEIRRTEMFYAGSDTWKVRFTGTRTGLWTFETSSDDPELDAERGTVEVTQNWDPDARGFLTTQDAKFVRQVDEHRVEPVMYMPFLDWSGDIAGQFGCSNIENLSCWDEDLIRAYARKAKDHGMSHIFLFLGNQWFAPDARSYDGHDSENPSLESFRQLEDAIRYARDEGVGVHMWAWGDESRRQTQVGLPGSINGEADRRLQRYISARLGPIPGWTMGYGYDLFEWVTDAQVDEWAAYMHEHMGWDHLLWARDRTGSNLDVESVGGTGPSSYAEVLDHVNSSKPHLEEERFLFGRTFRGVTYTTERTHDLLWWMAMAGAGGSAGFWGTDEGEYRNPEWLRTYSHFWKQYLRLDLAVDNSITDGYGLKSMDNTLYVIYKQDAGSVDVDLRSMAGRRRAVAVDTRAEYDEIDLGTVAPERFTWNAPHVSDWVIAVGTP